jgi:nicotinate phosphoribosyltransferase
MVEDVLALEGEAVEGEALLCPVMRQGRRLPGQPALQQIRDRCRQQLASLPAALRELVPATPYPVRVSQGLRTLADEVDREHAGALP